MLADRDGIVPIGAADVESVLAAAERKMATQADMVRAIRAGEDPRLPTWATGFSEGARAPGPADP